MSSASGKRFSVAALLATPGVAAIAAAVTAGAAAFGALVLFRYTRRKSEDDDEWHLPPPPPAGIGIVEEVNEKTWDRLWQEEGTKKLEQGERGESGEVEDCEDWKDISSGLSQEGEEAVVAALLHAVQAVSARPGASVRRGGNRREVEQHLKDMQYRLRHDEEWRSCRGKPLAKLFEVVQPETDESGGTDPDGRLQHIMDDTAELAELKKTLDWLVAPIWDDNSLSDLQRRNISMKRSR